MFVDIICNFHQFNYQRNSFSCSKLHFVMQTEQSEMYSFLPFSLHLIYRTCRGTQWPASVTVLLKESVRTVKQYQTSGRCRNYSMFHLKFTELNIGRKGRVKTLLKLSLNMFSILNLVSVNVASFPHDSLSKYFNLFFDKLSYSNKLHGSSLLFSNLVYWLILTFD